MLVCLPGILFGSLANSQRSFLNCFGKNYINTLASIVGISLHAIWLQIFVVNLQMDFIGVGIAFLCTETILLFSLLLFSQF